MRTIDLLKPATVFLIFYTTSVFLYGQSIKSFPNDIDINDYDKCVRSIDSLSLKESFNLLDFEGYRSSYDYSKIKFLDIDFDNNCEILHYFSSSARGWPHDFLSIYKIDNGTLLRVGDFPSFLLRFAESDGKYLQINLGTIGGEKTNPIYYNTVYRYNGQKFEPFYSPATTKEDFRQKGLNHYQKKDFSKALIYFKNALLTPHHNNGELLIDANNVAITLIKLNEFEKVTPLLNKYLKFCEDHKQLGAAYYNIGLANEYLEKTDLALENFKKSCRYSKTTACEEKIKKYAR